MDPLVLEELVKSNFLLAFCLVVSLGGMAVGVK